jgi:hypothetical protein
MQHEVNVELDIFEDELGNTTRLSKKQNSLYEKAIAAKQKEIQLQQRITTQRQHISDLDARIAAGDAGLQTSRDHATVQADRLDRMRQAAHNLAQTSQTQLTNSTRNLSGVFNNASRLHETGIRSYIGSMGNAGYAMTMLYQSIKFAYLHIEKYAKHATQLSIVGAGVLEGPNFDKSLSHMIREGFRLGIDPEALVKMSAEVRQSTNALGGLDAALGDTTQLAKDFYPLVGTIAGAQREALQAMHTFATKGIYPTTAALNQYKDDIYTQSKITGMGIEETKSLFEGLAGDADSLALLKSVRADDRESMLAHQRATLAANLALGMLPGQASAAGKSLLQMLSAKPKERFAKAARIEAFAGALGLGAEGHAAAQALRARRGSGDAAALSRASTNLTNAADQLAGSSIQSEFMVSALLENLHVESEFGPNSPFSTTLGTVIAKPLMDIQRLLVTGEESATLKVARQMELWQSQLDALKKGILIMDYIIQAIDAVKPYLESINSGVVWIGKGVIFAGEAILDTAKLLGHISLYIVNGIGFLISKAIANIAGLVGLDSLAASNESIATVQNERLTTALTDILNINSKWVGKLDTSSKTPDNTSDKIINPIDNLTTAVGDLTKTADKWANASPPIEQKLPTDIKSDQTIDLTKRNGEHDATMQMASSSMELLELSEKCNAKLDNQIAQLNQSNNYLKIIADNAPVLVDLAQKQLAATTMTEDQRAKYMSQLTRSNGKLAAEYASIS